MALVNTQECREEQNHGQVNQHHGEKEQPPGHSDHCRQRLSPEFVPWGELVIVMDASTMKVKHQSSGG
jgi:hypothetical protein